MKNRKRLLLTLSIIAVLSLSFQTPFFEIAKQIEIYNNLFKTLNKNYIDEINPGDLTNKVINNTLKDLDPYTKFYNEQLVEDSKISREGEYGGTGITCYYTKKGIIVSKVKEGYPGDKAGLKAGDIIYNVDGQNIEGLESAQLSPLLKGTPNTKLPIKLKRNGKSLDVTLTLDKIIIDAVPFYEMIDDNTGYVVLTKFINTKATNEVKAAIEALKEKGMTKLILDLRSNPGGSLYDAVNITNLFIPKGKIVVTTKGKTKANTKSYKTNREPLDTEMPVAVLINRKSASASEIVSGALQDYDRGVVIGQRSYGKGLVQRYFELNYGTQMKATISKYYTPSGRCIQELDYANRDPKTKKVPKFSDSGVNEFKTENGRTVLDGGGVLPDIIMEEQEKNEATKALLKSRTIFNFVTDYLNTNPTINTDNYSFSDFNVFKNYIKTEDSSFKTKQEKLFQKAFDSKKENNNITNEYSVLTTKLKTIKAEEISENKDIIIPLIENEILERFIYKKGLYKRNFTKDKTIRKAVNILSNTSEYNSILGK